jgi:hypothetical protein
MAHHQMRGGGGSKRGRGGERGGVAKVGGGRDVG